MKLSESKAIRYLRTLSFKTGVTVAASCGVFYLISFVQMFLPFSSWAKGVLWFIFFGLAKACQYTAILILGKVGVERIKGLIRR